MTFDKENTVDYIHEFAFEYGKLFRTKLTPDEICKRISEKMTSPEEFVDKLELIIELEKLTAIQDYLLSRGSNDEAINERKRELIQKLK